jgi:hypothetical protein
MEALLPSRVDTWWSTRAGVAHSTERTYNIEKAQVVAGGWTLLLQLSIGSDGEHMVWRQ